MPLRDPPVEAGQVMLCYVLRKYSKQYRLGWPRTPRTLANIIQPSTENGDVITGETYPFHPLRMEMSLLGRPILFLMRGRYPTRLKHLNHTFHFRPPAPGMSTFRSQPGGHTQTHKTRCTSDAVHS